jgi:hypothetical protein
MGNIYRGALKADAMKRCLYDYILLRVNATAYLMPCSRGYLHLVSETAEFKTVF